MDKSKLRLCAELLDQEICRHASTNSDAQFLASSHDLQRTIRDAKAERIEEPRQNAGLMRWIMDSNVQDIKNLTRLLLDFVYLLRGDDDVVGYQPSETSV